MTLDEAASPRLSAGGGVTWDGSAPAFAVNGVPLYQSPEWLAQQRNGGADVARIAELAGTSYHTIRKYLRRFGLQFSTAERSRLSGASQRGTKRTTSKRRVFTEDLLRIIREARSGVRSNFWKGGVTPERANIGRWTVEHAARVHAKYDFRCVACGGSQRLQAHHADPVWHNPARARDVDNLVTLCSPCHSRIHRHNLELDFVVAVARGATRDFWNGRVPSPRPSGKRRPRAAKLARTFVRIAQIEFAGEEMTYDVAVSGPYHNFVANGFIVHNSVNEYSGRYSLLPLLFYRPEDRQFQAQSQSNRQGRGGETLTGLYGDAIERWERTRRDVAAHYQWLVAHDVARELARIDLPLSTYTQWYWKIDLHNLFHFLSVRADPHAQYEIRAYARVMAGMLKRVAPLSFEAWFDYELHGAHLSRAELAALRRLVAVRDGRLAALPDARLGPADLAEAGLSKRELDEFLAKLADAPALDDFELDPSAARAPEDFAREMEAAVPRVDRKP
jgi:thymidylate synthase (FAD)